MRVCILTRSDLFPPNHGAAVKILRTAEHLAINLRQPAFILTADRDCYWRVENGISRCDIPRRSRAMQEWPILSFFSRRTDWICKWMGYPEEEFFLYSAQFDPAWVIRAVAVGLKEEIDVFQAEFPGYGLAAAMASRIVSTIRIGHYPITSIVQHNVEWDRLHSFGHNVQRIQRMEVLALKSVNEVIAVSLEDKYRMVEAGVDSSKITVIPHGVNCSEMKEGQARREHWRRHWNIEQEETVLFFHGTLHYWPNTEAVRFIAEQLIPELEILGLKYKIVVTGMNPPRYYAHPRIIFTEAVEDLAGHIHMADICICPLFAGGGTRLKLLEYFAAGRPVISTRKGAEGIPNHSQMRFAESAAEFAEQIVDLLGDSMTREAMALRGVNFAKGLDWSNVAQAYVDLYHGLDRGADWNKLLQQRTVDVEAFLPTRKPSKPLTLLLLLNNGCNLRCSFCDLWEHHQHMPLEKLRPVLVDAAAIGTKTLVITGGEPLLHPDVFTVVKEARALGLTVNITTNGTLVERHWDELMNCGVDSLSFSLDGLAVTHDRIRGQEGAFQRTRKALERVTQETDIDCNVYFVVTKDNVSEIWDVYTLAKELGARFDFWPVNDAPELNLSTVDEIEMWNHQVERISKEEEDIKSRSSFYKGGLDYHLGQHSGAMRCLGFVDQYGVTYEGDLLPCCVWQGKGLVKGNVFERSLKELWYSSEIQSYRQSLVEEGCTVGCFNHSLYEFTESTGYDFRLGEV